MQMLQYTIRNLPKEIDRVLRRKAKEEHMSLNQTVLEILKQGIGLANEVPEHHDLDFLIASWQEDPEAEKAIHEQRRIDPEKWS